MIASALKTGVLMAERGIRRRRDVVPMSYIGAHSGRNLGDDLLRGIASTALSWTGELIDYEESWHERRLAVVGLSGRSFFSGCVLGGGTLISGFWAGKVERALLQGLPMWTLGTGVGACGFIDDETQDLSRWAPMLRQFRGLGVRGPRSVARLAAIGVDGAEVVGDPALLLARDRARAAASEPVVALNLSSPAGGDRVGREAAWLAKAASTLRAMVNAGWRVRPFLMNEQDRSPTQDALQGLPKDRVNPVVRPADAEALMDHLGDCHLTLAVRLHAAVLSCSVGVPPVLLGYREKCQDFMESMDLGDWCPDMTRDDPAVLPGLVRRLGDDPDGLRGARILDSARGHADALRRYGREITASLVASS